MLTYIPARIVIRRTSRKAGNARSFRALCEGKGYSAALTAALLATAARRYAEGLPVVWPAAS
jgi:hypothetical protein